MQACGLDPPILVRSLKHRSSTVLKTYLPWPFPARIAGMSQWTPTLRRSIVTSCSTGTNTSSTTTTTTTTPTSTAAKQQHVLVGGLLPYSPYSWCCHHHTLQQASSGFYHHVIKKKFLCCAPRKWTSYDNVPAQFYLRCLLKYTTFTITRIQRKSKGNCRRLVFAQICNHHHDFQPPNLPNLKCWVSEFRR